MFHPATLGIVGVLVALVVWWGYRSSESLATDVGVFAASQKLFSEAAFLPGAATNPARDSANRALAAVLSENISADSRLEYAKDGLVFTKILEGEIDAIATARDTTAGARTQLSNDRFSLSALVWERRLTDLLTLADTQADIIADIRGLSYSANYHTSQIFQQIVDDNGALSRAYVAKLNSEIPQVESDFNKRSNLYLDLQKVNSDIRHALASLPGGGQ